MQSNALIVVTSIKQYFKERAFLGTYFLLRCTACSLDSGHRSRVDAKFRAVLLTVVIVAITLLRVNDRNELSTHINMI